MILSKELLINPYKANTVLINGLTSGSGSIEIKVSGVYYIEAVGEGGHDGAFWLSHSPPWYYAGGGSGAAFAGEIYLQKGTYSYSVGAPTNFGGIVIANRGNDAWGDFYVGYGGGTGGIITLNTTPIATTVMANGNTGGIGAGVGASGGASVYGGYGYGMSTNGGSPGTGYLKLTYKRRR